MIKISKVDLIILSLLVLIIALVVAPHIRSIKAAKSEFSDKRDAYNISINQEQHLCIKENR